jgi:hypothetical protein
MGADTWRWLTTVGQQIKSGPAKIPAGMKVVICRHMDGGSGVFMAEVTTSAELEAENRPGCEAWLVWADALVLPREDYYPPVNLNIRNRPAKRRRGTLLCHVF